MPSPLTLAQLRAGYTLEQATEDMLAQLTLLGFSASSWQEGSPERTIVVIVAWIFVQLRAFVAALSYVGFNSGATGDILTEFSDSHYDNQRVLASAAQVRCVLTGAAIGPPHTFSAGELIGTDGTLTFRCLEGGTIGASTTLAVTFACERLGTVGNVADNTITTLSSPLAGVTINNPDPGTGTSIVVLGTDEEMDAALQARNSAKWATLSTVEAIADRFEAIARTAVTNCRVAVDDANPDGPGTLTVYLAADDGVATGGEVTLVDAAIDAAHFGGTHTTVAAAADVLAVTATVYYDPSYVSATVQAAVEDAIDAYVNAAPIGGYMFGSGADNIIDRDGLFGAMRAVAGVRKVSMTLPAGDFSVDEFDVATVGVVTLTMTASS